MTFYSGQINNLEDFEDYCRVKGVQPFHLAETNDGYYAEIKKGTANLKDFTQIGLPTCGDLDRLKTAELFPERFEWVKLSFKDSSNSSILNA